LFGIIPCATHRIWHIDHPIHFGSGHATVELKGEWGFDGRTCTYLDPPNSPWLAICCFTEENITRYPNNFATGESDGSEWAKKVVDARAITGLDL